LQQVGSGPDNSGHSLAASNPDYPMSLQLKLWTRAGACALLGAGAAGASPPALVSAVSSAPWSAQEGGEGGGEAGGTLPSQYRLMLDETADPQYDGAAIASAYADDVRIAYEQSRDAAHTMQGAIEALLARPGADTLAAARAAWLAARRPYLATEPYRFYDGPIDAPETGPEGRINAWPLNEAVIDYVEGDAKAGLVNAVDVSMTRETILSHDQVSDEADVTTGWHAIEFLLWGQDRSADGPGARPASDFAPGTPVNDRRRDYLRLLAALLAEDLDAVARQWDRTRPDSYAAQFLALEPHEAVGRALTGAALLAGHELASERLAVGLDSGAQEDEQSCFSDSTWQDFAWGLAGIKRVYYGRSAPDASPAAAIRKLQPKLALEMERRFAEAERRVARLHDPFDRILASAPGSPLRADAEAAVAALQQLAAGLRDVGRALGVLVIVPGA
jgi:putative iron-regulated protein